MKEKFKKIPQALQKQIIIKYGAALVSLFLMAVSLLLERNLYLSLSFLIFFAFFGFSASQLLYRSAAGQFIMICGQCTRLERTPIRRHIRTLYLWADPHTVKVQITGKLRNINVGDAVAIYVSDNTPVYESEGCQQLSTYLAIDIFEGSESP